MIARRFLLVALPILCAVFSSLAWGEDTSLSPNGPIWVLRGVFSPWHPWVLEADPTQWTYEMWQQNQMSPSAWADAIRSWQSDPKVAMSLERGRTYRQQYLETVARDANRILSPKNEERAGALERTVRDLAALIASQQANGLGPPTRQQLETFVLNETQYLRQSVSENPTDDDLNWQLKEQTNRSTRRGEESEFPRTDKSTPEHLWRQWRDTNRRATEREVTARFRQAVAIAEKSDGLKIWLAGKRVRTEDLEKQDLKIDWGAKKITGPQGENVTFSGDSRLVRELENFLDGSQKPLGSAPSPKKDGAFTAIHRLRQEATALESNLRDLDKVSHGEVNKRLLLQTQRKSQDLNLRLSNPQASSPLEG